MLQTFTESISQYLYYGPTTYKYIMDIFDKNQILLKQTNEQRSILDNYLSRFKESDKISKSHPLYQLIALEIDQVSLNTNKPLFINFYQDIANNILPKYYKEYKSLAQPFLSMEKILMDYFKEVEAPILLANLIKTLSPHQPSTSISREITNNRESIYQTSQSKEMIAITQNIESKLVKIENEERLELERLELERLELERLELERLELERVKLERVKTEIVKLERVETDSVDQEQNPTCKAKEEPLKRKNTIYPHLQKIFCCYSPMQATQIEKEAREILRELPQTNKLTISSSSIKSDTSTSMVRDFFCCIPPQLDFQPKETFSIREEVSRAELYIAPKSSTNITSNDHIDSCCYCAKKNNSNMTKFTQQHKHKDVSSQNTNTLPSNINQSNVIIYRKPIPTSKEIVQKVSSI